MQMQETALMMSSSKLADFILHGTSLFESETANIENFDSVIFEKTTTILKSVKSTKL